MHKPAVTDAPLIDAINDRWSALAYDPDREIAPADLRTLLEAARWAPSARNEQPWRFIVLDGTVPEAREKARDSLPKSNFFAKAAPLMLLAVARGVYKYSGDFVDHRNPWAQWDTGAAVQTLLLQAVTMGIYGRELGLFDLGQLRQDLEIPEAYELGVLIAMGYPGDPDNLTSNSRAVHEKARARRPLEDIAFVGTWGESIK
ncbi:MAG: nitroreductase family protein [Chloroflexota bacterium]|jgi:nitroreductase|nr:nitroreductase family protein [Chloroflexota bacterium]MDP6757857.1 nitroreductase family protein [Chloroflexota bacterium]